MKVVSRRRALVAALVVAGCGDPGGGSGAIAVRSVWHMETRNSEVGGDLVVSAIDYLRSLDGELELGLSPQGDWEPVSIVDSDGLRHVRLKQIYGGVRVVHGDAVVHADETTFIGLSGMVLANLDGFDTTAALGEAAAREIAEQDRAGGAQVEYAEETAELVILPRESEGADLAWHVELASEAGGGLDAGDWHEYVDARSGELLWTYDGATTLEQGSGPGGNLKRARTWNAELDVELMGDEYRMKTARFETQDRSKHDEVVHSPDLANLPDPQANDAHGHAEITLEMMGAWMGRNSLDDAGLPILSRVHDTSACPGAPANACWSFKKMNYGDGGFTFLPLSSALDVVAHELNHGFTQFHSNLDYAGEPGGLNESFSDVAGVVAEYFDEGEAADMLIGEDIALGGDAIRWMCLPSNDGSSADYAYQVGKRMDPHHASGVPNRAFCLAVARYKATGAGHSTLEAVRDVGHIWYTANGSYWTAGSQFTDACRGTVDAARALGQSGEVAEQIAQSWADVGVNCDSSVFVCNADGSCDAGAGETCASCGEDCGACSGNCSKWKRAKCKLGIGDCSQCDSEPGCGDGVCDGSETDASCGVDCGCQALQCEAVAPFGCWCDATCEQTGDCCADRATCQ